MGLLFYRNTFAFCEDEYFQHGGTGTLSQRTVTPSHNSLKATNTSYYKMPSVKLHVHMVTGLQRKKTDILREAAELLHNQIVT